MSSDLKLRVELQTWLLLINSSRCRRQFGLFFLVLSLFLFLLLLLLYLLLLLLLLFLLFCDETNYQYPLNVRLSFQRGLEAFTNWRYFPTKKVLVAVVYDCCCCARKRLRNENYLWPEFLWMFFLFKFLSLRRFYFDGPSNKESSGQKDFWGGNSFINDVSSRFIPIEVQGSGASHEPLSRLANQWWILN